MNLLFYSVVYGGNNVDNKVLLIKKKFPSRVEWEQKYKKGLSLNLIIKLGIKEFIGPKNIRK